MKYTMHMLVLLLLAAPLKGQLILQPPGLNPGDQYRLVFMTSTVRDATSGDIEEYNEFVQSTADAAPVVGVWGLEWKAIVSTVDISARDNTQTDATLEEGLPVYRLDGELVWRDNEHLWETEMGDVEVQLSSFALTELGTMPDQESSLFWAGNRPDGSSPQILPGTGQSIALGQAIGSVGHPLGLDKWNVEIEQTELQFPMLAISEVITVVPEPECSAALLLITFLYAVRPRSRAGEAATRGCSSIAVSYVGD